MFGGFKKSRTFATAIERESDKKLKGALVQLVRIHACHASVFGICPKIDNI